MISNRVRWIIYGLALTTLFGLPAMPLFEPEEATIPGHPNSAESTSLTPEQAIAVAVNDLEATGGGYHLRHPRHMVEFVPHGLKFRPRRGGPEWRWQLSFVGAGEMPLAGVETGPVRPISDRAGVVAYLRGGLVEQYLARQKTIEQQFVISRPLALEGADLVIAGEVHSPGAFETTEEGWLWRNDDGVVSLGRVRVYDAAGREVPATLTVTEHTTRITVNGPALAQATYPVTIDPEIGTNDFRLSDMGQADSYDATAGAVAYNSANNEYLVVWQGNDNIAPLLGTEFEIFGQRLNAATGAEIGADFQISDMGPNGVSAYAARNPAVAYNSANNEYLVVWQGDDNTAPLVDNEVEVFGQRVNAATGAQVGANDFRLSDMGPDGNPSYTAATPAVAYNSLNNEYLVVWWGDDNIPPLVDNEFEIFGQRLNAATGAQVGTNDFRLSDMGPDGNSSYAAANPAVAYNSLNNEYLVVWEGEDNIPPLVDNELEIFGQRLNAATGAQVGANDFRLSDMGSDGNSSYAAAFPAVAHNSANNEYLVVWRGDDNTPPLVDNEFEIFGQRLNAVTGAQVGTNDFRLSDMGPDGNPSYIGVNPAVAYNSANNEYLVVWWGDDNTPPLVNNEFEIFGQRVNAASGIQVGTNDFRLSDMGPDGNLSYAAAFPAVAYNSANNEDLVVWQGDDNNGSLVDDEFEIFGQRLSAGTPVGANDARLSDMGPDGDTLYDAANPAVAYNSLNNEYLVVWQGDDNTSPLVDEELEIFGQRVNAATGAEVGANDFRISDMGPNGNPNYDAFSPAVAYNSANNEYLVVWQGDGGAFLLVDNKFDIYGQRLNAATGAEVGANDFVINNIGALNEIFAATAPAVAYNSANNEYLVVWSGDRDTLPLVNDEFEIFGQRLNAATGAEVGVNDFRLSDMGLDGDPNYGAFLPVVAYNNASNQYLVVWQGDDNTPPLADEELEIFGQRLNAATGAQVGGNDVRLSDMGPDGDLNFDASNPAVAYNSANNEYLVVWQGDDNTAPLVDEELEIFGQRLTAATGVQVGGNDIRLSDMGPDGDLNFDASNPAVAYNSLNNEYLVVWQSDDNSGLLVNDELEIFGQQLNAATGTEVGPNDARLSDMGPDGEANYDAFSPAVAYNSLNNESLVVWRGDDNSGALLDEEFEIFGQRFSALAEHHALYLPVVLK